MTPAKTLTHLDADGRPAMVDVSGKAVGPRQALAECRVRFPAAVAAQLRAIVFTIGRSTRRDPRSRRG